MDELPSAVDVAVVGAGVAGAATALFLARAGAAVALVDGGRPGSAAGLGFVDAGVIEPPHRTIDALGPGDAAELFAFTERSATLAAEEGLLAEREILWVAAREEELPGLAASVDALRGLGRAAIALDGSAVEARVGVGRFVGGAVFGGGRVAGDARDALLARGRAAGVRVVEGRASIAEGRGPVEVRVGDRSCRAEVLVIAAGSASPGLDPRLADALLPVRDAAIALPRDGRLRAGAARAGQGWTAWYVRDDDRVVVSGARWATPHLEVGETDVTRVDGRVRAKLSAFARGSLELGGPVEACWAWAFASTRDGLPVIGPIPGSSRRIALVGGGPSPASFALAGARAVADGLCGDGGGVPERLASRRLVRWAR